MIYQLTPAKHPDEVWGLAVDFSNRLDTTNGETVTSAEVKCYKLFDYRNLVAQYDLSDVNRITVILERSGQLESRYSYLIQGQPTAQLHLPSSYDPEDVTLEMAPPSSISIGPDPDNDTVSFDLQGGEDNCDYLLVVTALTSNNYRHMCAIGFSVRENVIWP